MVSEEMRSWQPVRQVPFPSVSLTALHKKACSKQAGAIPLAACENSRHGFCVSSSELCFQEGLGMILSLVSHLNWTGLSEEALAEAKRQAAAQPGWLPELMPLIRGKGSSWRTPHPPLHFSPALI